MVLNEILAEAIRNDASDVLLKVGVPPAFRVRADFLPLEGAEPLDVPAVQAIVDCVLDDNRRRRLEQDMQVDLAYPTPELGRLRVDIFRQRGFLSLVIRVIPPKIRSRRVNMRPRSERLDTSGAPDLGTGTTARARARRWRRCRL